MSPSPLVWAALVGGILGLLALDLKVVHRRPDHVSFKEAAVWSGIWLALGLGFALVVWAMEDGTAAGAYLAGFVMEKGLSMDNVFVFAVLLGALGVPAALRGRVLSFGITGALALRAVFIVAGVALVEAFHPALYVFGALLVITGVRLAVKGDHEEGEPRLATLARRWSRGHVLIPALVAVALADLLFAVDSVPAVLAITTDTFIVFAANAFALLGLRALYFLLTGMADRFAYLQYGLAALLVFVGGKMLLEDVIGKVPIAISLAAIVAILGASIGASLVATRERAHPARG